MYLKFCNNDHSQDLCGSLNIGQRMTLAVLGQQPERKEWHLSEAHSRQPDVPTEMTKCSAPQCQEPLKGQREFPPTNLRKNIQQGHYLQGCMRSQQFGSHVYREKASLSDLSKVIIGSLNHIAMSARLGIVVVVVPL